jgi:hypothetical protein
MTKKNIKDLVKQIEKMAQAAPPPPAGALLDPGGAAPVVTPTAPHGGGGGGGGNVAIMAMQHALQDLAQDVSSQINLQEAFSGVPEKEKEAKERDAFGVFLTKNYMRNTKVKGVEYDPDPAVTDVNKKRPDDPTRMSIVMDTMSRIGHPKKGENVVDGAWGPRTNAAICDAHAFASGLLSFVDDVNRFATKKLHINSYDKSKLDEFAVVIKPDNSLTPTLKIQSAPFVTQNVKSIKEMYDEVKNQILQHPAYQQFIEGAVPFKSYKPKVTPQQIDAVSKAFPRGIELTFPDFKTKINITDLVSLDALKTWMQRAAPDAVARGTLTPQLVLNQVRAAQAKLSGTNTSETG